MQIASLIVMLLASMNIVLWIAFPSSSRAATDEHHSTRANCIKDVRDIASVGILVKPNLLEKYQLANTDNFRVKEVGEGPNGGEILTIEYLRSWGDGRKDFNPDGQGDIVLDMRFFPTVLGEKEAKYFGYEILDDRRVRIPSITELNQAIAKFNHGLDPADPAYMAVSPYESEGVFGDPISYLERFANEGKVPASDRYRQFYHDRFGHALEGFFFRNTMLRAAMNRTLLWLDFRRHMFEKLSGDDRALFSKLDDEAVNYLIRRIDEWGNVIFLFLPRHEYLHLKSFGQKVAKQNNGAEIGIQSSVVKADYTFDSEDQKFFGGDFSVIGQIPRDEWRNPRLYLIRDLPIFEIFHKDQGFYRFVFDFIAFIHQQLDSRAFDPSPGISIELNSSSASIEAMKIINELPREEFFRAIQTNSLAAPFTKRLERLRKMIGISH